MGREVVGTFLQLEIIGEYTPGFAKTFCLGLALGLVDLSMSPSIGQCVSSLNLGLKLWRHVCVAQRSRRHIVTFFYVYSSLSSLSTDTETV